MQEVIENGKEIIDISDEKKELHPNFIDWFEKEKHGFYRLNKQQIQAIVRRVYVPWQVSQYNKSVKEGKIGREELILADEIAKAMDKISNLHDAYCAIPAGMYYYWSDSQFNEAMIHEQIIKNGSPFHFFARKRFTGFVTKSVEYSLGGIFEMPERDVFVSWDLEGQPQVNPGNTMNFNADCNPLDEQGLEKTIRENYSLWNQWFNKLSKDNMGLEVPDFSEAESIFEAPEFLFLVDRSKARKFGFIPFTEYYGIRNADDIYGFMTRWLNYSEGGISFLRPKKPGDLHNHDNVDHYHWLNLFYVADQNNFRNYLREHVPMPHDGKILTMNVEDWAYSVGFKQKKR